MMVVTAVPNYHGWCHNGSYTFVHHETELQMGLEAATDMETHRRILLYQWQHF